LPESIKIGSLFMAGNLWDKAIDAAEKMNVAVDSKLGGPQAVKDVIAADEALRHGHLIEANKLGLKVYGDIAEKAGERFRQGVHAVNAAGYNEKTAKASDKAIDALAHGDVKGYGQGAVEVHKAAFEALGQDVHDLANKVKRMFGGGAHEVTGAPHEVVKSSAGVKPAASEAQKS
jgi:hypothetical protein